MYTEKEKVKERQEQVWAGLICLGFAAIVSLIVGLTVHSVFYSETPEEHVEAFAMETDQEEAVSVETHETNVVQAPVEMRYTMSGMVEEESMQVHAATQMATKPLKPEKRKVSKKKKTKKQGKKMFVPAYCGSCHPYMGWECITDETSPQYKLKQEAESYDSDGFGKVRGRYAVAMKPYYGKIGDYINVVQTDGVEYKCIIVDYKGMENEAEDGWLATYCHGLNDIIEFVVDKDSWYGTDKTVNQIHPEFDQHIEKIYNVGNYWDK